MWTRWGPAGPGLQLWPCTAAETQQCQPRIGRDTSWDCWADCWGEERRGVLVVFMYRFECLYGTKYATWSVVGILATSTSHNAHDKCCTTHGMRASSWSSGVGVKEAPHTLSASTNHQMPTGYSYRECFIRATWVETQVKKQKCVGCKHTNVFVCIRMLICVKFKLRSGKQNQDNHKRAETFEWRSKSINASWKFQISKASNIWII